MDTLIIICAKYVIVLVGLGVIVTALRVPKSERIKFGVTVAAACVIAFVLSRIASHLYFDPRPFVTEHVKPLVDHAADNGFPSDHALLTMTFTAAVYFFSKKIAFAMLACTVAVGVGRVLAKVHSPLDIGAAWLIGIVGAVVAYYATTYFLAKRHRKAV